MRLEINLEKDLLGDDGKAAKMFGYLVYRGFSEGAVLILTESPISMGRYLAAYHFGQEAPDSDMFGGSALGMGKTPAEALAAVLDDLGVMPEEVDDAMRVKRAGE